MNANFYAGLGKAELIIRAGHVKRWHLVPMSVTQTIAEHQYNVAMLCMLIHPQPDFDTNIAARWALIHDLPEVVTGDVPTHVKAANPELKSLLGEIESEAMPDTWNQLHVAMLEYPFTHRIFKACDLADTLRMAKYITNPKVREFVEAGLRPAFESHLAWCSPEGVTVLTDYVQNG